MDHNDKVRQDVIAELIYLNELQPTLLRYEIQLGFDCFNEACVRWIGMPNRTSLFHLLTTLMRAVSDGNQSDATSTH